MPGICLSWETNGAQGERLCFTVPQITAKGNVLFLGVWLGGQTPKVLCHHIVFVFFCFWFLLSFFFCTWSLWQHGSLYELRSVKGIILHNIVQQSQQCQHQSKCQLTFWLETFWHQTSFSFQQIHLTIILSFDNVCESFASCIKSR